MGAEYPTPRRRRKLGPPIRLTEELILRFWDNVDRGDDDQCWLWRGYRRAGYGNVWSVEQKRYVGAHRVSWQLASGRDIPYRLVVRHKCDNPPCVNPAHLEIGTDADNVRDFHERGHGLRGEHNGFAKLTEAKAREVFRLYESGMTQVEVAAVVGVSKDAVWRILAGINWKHLGVPLPVRRKAAKLTPVNVREIRLAAAGGEPHYKIAARYGVNKRAVWQIIHRICWKHVD